MLAHKEDQSYGMDVVWVQTTCNRLPKKRKATFTSQVPTAATAATATTTIIPTATTAVSDVGDDMLSSRVRD